MILYKPNVLLYKRQIKGRGSGNRRFPELRRNRDELF